MKIIDFKKKGNVFRFYLGEETPEWGWTRPDYTRNGQTPDWLKPSDKYYGDDWDDKPYEHNASQVYEEFIKGYKDVAFNFDDLVLEPADGAWNGNSRWCKYDMVNRKVPCIIIVPKEVYQDSWDDAFDTWAGADGIKKYYLGDDESIF